MHPLILRFAGELEDEFADQYFTMTLTQVRGAVLAVLVFTYSSAFRQYRELAISAAVVIAALGNVAMLAVIPS